MPPTTSVTTTKGRLRGLHEDGLTIFRGIPFAAPPTGERRFRAPAEAAAWEGDRDATKFGPASLQLRPVMPEGARSPFAGMFDEGELETDEDCLTLNVWTPGLGDAAQPDGARRPVMVWIHGGAFRTGTGASPMYDGAALAKRGDVVVVTLNYRLGYLGFLYLPELGGGANFGILDQVKGLEWVRDEIAAFGGDPDNVTIFGESAGGKSVETLLATPPARGLFHKAILQSTYETPMDSASASGAADALLAELGIARGEAARLRELPAKAIVEAQLRLQMAAMASGAGGGGTAPTVDGEVLPQLPREAIRGGAVADVPMLIGTNIDEFKLFAVMQPGLRDVDEPGVARRIMGSGADASTRDHALAEYKAARAARGASTSPIELLSALSSDSMFRVHSTRVAEEQAAHQARTFMYLFTWASPVVDALGSCHALELPFVFRTFDAPLGKLAQGERTAESVALSGRMQDAWLAFAQTGAPGHPGLPVWPAYDSSRRATMVLDATCQVVEAPLERERLAWLPLAAAVVA